MFSQYSAVTADLILLSRYTGTENTIALPNGYESRLPERSTLLTLIATVMVLLVVAVIIIGTGLHSGLVWLILAGICIAWVFVCSCSNCKKVANLRCGRTRERSDTVSTISDFNDLAYVGYSDPVPMEEARIWATLDLPPSYDVVSDSREQQPPSYASAVTLLNSTNNSHRLNISGSPTLPPPYSDRVHSNNGTIGTGNNNYGNSGIATINANSEEQMQRNVLSLSEDTPISIISGCNLNENTQKITNVVSSQELPTLVNECHILTYRYPSVMYIHNVDCEEENPEHSSSCYH